MKKIILIMSVFISFAATAQFLSLKDLMKLQSKKLNDAQEYLAKNDWKFSNAKELKEQKMNQVSFAYGIHKLDLKQAKGWLRYIFNEEKGIVRINYEIYSSAEFNDLLATAKRKDFLLLDRKIKNGVLTEVYHNNEYYFTFRQIKIENPVYASVRYQVLLKSAADTLSTIKSETKD